MKTYRVIFSDNTGSFSIDAIAESASASWRNTVRNYDGEGNDIGFVDVDDDNADYLETMMNMDPNVIEWNEA